MFPRQLKRQLKIVLIILATVVATLYLTYLLQSGRVVFSTSKSEARGEPEEEEEEKEAFSPVSNPSGSFYDWLLCTTGSDACPTIVPRRR